MNLPSNVSEMTMMLAVTDARNAAKDQRYVVRKVRGDGRRFDVLQRRAPKEAHLSFCSDASRYLPKHIGC